MNVKLIAFGELPSDERHMKEMDSELFFSPYNTAAMAVAVLCRYGSDPDRAMSMLDDLCGGRPLGLLQRSRLIRGLKERGYIPFSYFEGATTVNGYEPTKPYRIEVYSAQKSYLSDRRVKLFVRSSGSPDVGSVTLEQVNYKWYVRGLDIVKDVEAPMK